MGLRKGSVRGWGLFTFLGLIASSILLAFAAENTRNPAYVDAIWVGQEDSLIKHSTDSGEAVLEIPGLDDLHRIALDGQAGHIWAATEVALYRYDFAGKLLGRTLYTNLPVSPDDDHDSDDDDNEHQKHQGKPGKPKEQDEDDHDEGEHEEEEFELEVEQLLVDSSTNNLYLATEHDLYRFNAEGELLTHHAIGGRIVALAHSPEKDRLWVATKRTILIYTGDLGQCMGEIDIAGQHRGAVRDMAYDPHLQQWWVLGNQNLLRLDEQDNVLFEQRIKQADSFDIDGQGNLWLAGEKSLLYLNSQGQKLLQIDPFDEKHENKIRRLIVDRADQSVWVTDKSELVHVDTNGEIQQRIETGDKIRDIALYRDTVPPTIQFILPSDNGLTNNPLPTIQLLHQDAGIGVDPETLVISQDSNPLPVDCTHSLDTAVCDPQQPFTDGQHQLEANVEDYAGNASEPASVRFTLDTVPPTVTVDSPPNPYSTNNPQLTVSGNLSEAATLTLNGQPLTLDAQLGFQAEVELQEGNNTLTLQATDPAGNTAQVQLLVMLDTVPPDAAQSSKIAVGQAINGMTTVSGVEGAVEPEAWVQITNTKSGQASREQAGPDGQFSMSIGAAPADLLQIVVIDQAENSSDPISLQVPVPLSIEVTSPRDGATISGETVYVEGSYHGLMNTGITVNGVPAAVTPEGTFVSREIELEAGTNTLEVVGTTLNGLTVQQTLTVTSDGVSTPLEFTSNVNSGITPLPVEFELGWYSAKEAQSVKIDFNGDGVLDVDSTGLQETYSTTYNEPGIYHATSTVTDADGQVFNNTAVIQVQSAETMDQLFRSTWNGMNSALIDGDLATAARYLDDFGNRKYQPVFEVLLDQMPQIISSYTSFKQVDINSEVTIYALNRPDGTRNRVYFVYFMQDRTGIWKIHSM